jgi:diguanylate cyclase
MHAMYEPSMIGLSFLLAVFAAFVSLEIAYRVRRADSSIAVMWSVVGAAVMGSAFWATHFLGMLATQLPIELGFRHSITLALWPFAVTVCMVGMRWITREHVGWVSIWGGGVGIGLAVSAVHAVGMTAVDLDPAIVWYPPSVVAAVCLACGACVIGQCCVAWMRRLPTSRIRWAQAAAALAFGIGVAGPHHVAMVGADFAFDVVCLSGDGLSEHSLVSLIVTVAVVLSMAVFAISALDVKFSSRAQRLTQSLQEANGELARMAFSDPLTGAANRALLDDRLLQAINRVDRANTQAGGRHPPSHVGLLFIDLDGFRAINDGFGHGVGDSVIKQIADRFKLCLSGSSSLARVAGDEFVVLMDEMADVAEAVTTAERLLDCLRSPVRVTGRPITMSCSIGWAIYPDHCTRERLLSCAESAMEQAKCSGGGRWVMFDARMGHDAAEQIELSEDLRHAAERGELHLHYQPKVDARSGCIRSLEALVRWKHPARGMLSPALFIPIAERFGQINILGQWVIEEACRQLGVWNAQGRQICTSVNLSAYQLRQEDLAQQIAASMARHGIKPSQLICEITESVAMADTDITQRVLAGLSQLGVRLSIDDFGTGYSSLSYLCQLRADELKIDRSFVRELPANGDARAVVDAVIRLARALNLKVVAEGVETREQRELLLDLGCDELQGYYIAKPMEADALEAGGLLTSDGMEAVEFSTSVYAREP